MAKRYVCEDCKRLGTMDDFRDECRPGWTHGRLIGPVVDAPSPQYVPESLAERQQRLMRVERGGEDG